MKPGFLDIRGVKIRLDEIVAVYDVWPLHEFLPFPRFVVKVLHRAGGDYQAVPNICVRNVKTGDCEYICGLGDNPDQALVNALENLFGEVQQQAQVRQLEEKDFVVNHHGY
jgi:hypothetical protein